MMAFTALSCMILAVCGIVVLWKENLLSRTRDLWIVSGLCVFAVCVRLACINHVTPDYIKFLFRWMKYFRQNGGFSALSGNIGNYNVPYLYFLALFSYFNFDDLYLIKLLSIAFDFVLAWGCLKLVGLFTESTLRRIVAFLAVLFLPSVVLNGACWGQCDSTYVAFAVWSLYFALSERPIRSVICITLSFAFKLQSVFIMPIFLVLIFAKRVRWWHLLFFPLVYLAIVAPALLLGKPLVETLTLYISQGHTVGSGLNYNSPSVFSFFSNITDKAEASWLGIIAAFSLVFIIFLWTYLHRSRLSNQTILLCALLFSVGIPYLLPYMHDRYFFSADILSLAVAVILPKYAPIPALVSFASLLGYHVYLRGWYLLPMRYGAVALGLVLVIIIAAIATEFYRVLRQHQNAEKS